MKSLIKIVTTFGFVLMFQLAYSGEILDTYAKGDTLTATTLNNIKSAVNDNNSRITNLNRNSLDAADGSPSDALFIDDIGNVGIGTSTPASSLTVTGSDPWIESHNTIGAMRWRFGTDSDQTFNINKATGTTFSPFVINDLGQTFFTRDSPSTIPNTPCTTLTINARLPDTSGCIEGLMIADTAGGAIWIGHSVNNGQNLTLAWLGGAQYGRLQTRGGPLALQATTGQDVGIGTSTPTTKLQVNGTITATAFVQASDERLKKDIKPIESPVQKIKNLKGVTYEWKTTFSPDLNLDNGKQLGLLAQNVLKTVPEAVKVSGEQSYSVNYSMMIPLLIEAMKEQQQMIESLRLQLQELKKGE